MKPSWLALALGLCAIISGSNVAEAATRVCVSVEQKSWYRPGGPLAPRRATPVGVDAAPRAAGVLPFVGDAAPASPVSFTLAERHRRDMAGPDFVGAGPAPVDQPPVPPSSIFTPAIAPIHRERLTPAGLKVMVSGAPHDDRSDAGSIACKRMLEYEASRTSPVSLAVDQLVGPAPRGRTRTPPRAAGSPPGRRALPARERHRRCSRALHEPVERHHRQWPLPHQPGYSSPPKASLPQSSKERPKVDRAAARRMFAGAVSSGWRLRCSATAPARPDPSGLREQTCSRPARR